MKKKRGNTDLVPNDSPAKKVSKLATEDEGEEGDEGKNEAISANAASAASGSIEAAAKIDGDINRKEKPQTLEDIRRLQHTKHNREMMLLGQRWADPCRLETLKNLEPVNCPVPTALGAPPRREVQVENALLNNCVLKHLFGYLADYPQLPNLRTVCKKWNEEIVLQTRKNPKYEVKLGGKVHGQNDVTKFIEEMQETIHFPFGYFYFGHYLSKSCTNQIYKMFEKYGGYMKSVQFVLHVGHYMTQGKFAGILDTLTNLEELSIFGFPSAISSTNNFIYELQRVRPRLLKLKKFRLTHPGQDPYTKSLLESDYSTEFLTILFKNSPNLRSLALHWPTESKASTITHFVTAVCNSYTGSDSLLHLELKCAITEPHISTLLDSKLKLESLSIGYLDHNVDRRTFEDLLKKIRLSLKTLDIGDGSYETPELFVWARGDSISITFPRMEKLETLVLKCDGTHEFRKLGFTQICFRTQLPALKSLMFVESPASIDYIHKFLLPLPLPLTISQKSYTVSKLQISGSLRLLRKGFFTPRNFVKLLSKRFPALSDLNMYHATIDLLPHIWKYFKRIEDLHLVIAGSDEGPTYIDEAITGIDEGVCKWFSKNPDASVDLPFISSICETKKRSICDLKKLRDFTIDIIDAGQPTNHRICMTDSTIYFALVNMESLESLVMNSYNITPNAVEYLKRKKVGKKFRTCDIKILIPRGYVRVETDDEIYSSDSEDETAGPVVVGKQQNDDFIMALAVNYTDFEQDDANNSGDDEDDDQDQDQNAAGDWEDHSDAGSNNSDFEHDSNHGSIPDDDSDILDDDDNDVEEMDVEVDPFPYQNPNNDDVFEDVQEFEWPAAIEEDFPLTPNPHANDNSQDGGNSVQFSGTGSGRSLPFSDDEDDRQVEDMVEQGRQGSNEEFVLGRFFKGLANNVHEVSMRERRYRSPLRLDSDDSSVEEVVLSSPASSVISSQVGSRGRATNNVNNSSPQSHVSSSDDESSHEFDYIRSPSPRPNYSDDDDDSDSDDEKDNDNCNSVDTLTRDIPLPSDTEPSEGGQSSRSRGYSRRSPSYSDDSDEDKKTSVIPLPSDSEPSQDGRSSVSPHSYSHRSPSSVRSSSASTRRVESDTSVFGDDSDDGASRDMKFGSRSPSVESDDDDQQQNEASGSSSASDEEESPLVWDSNSDEEAVDDEENDVESEDRVEYGGPDSDKSADVEEDDEEDDEMEELEVVDDEEHESDSGSEQNSDENAEATVSEDEYDY